MAKSSCNFSSRCFFGIAAVAVVLADPIEQDMTSARRAFSIDVVAVKRPETPNTPVPSIALPQVQAPSLPGLLPFQGVQPGGFLSGGIAFTSTTTTTAAPGFFQAAAAAVPFLSNAEQAVGQAEKLATAKLGEAQKTAASGLAQAEKKATPIIRQATKTATTDLGQAGKAATAEIGHLAGNGQTTPAPGATVVPGAAANAAMAAANAKIQQAQEEKEKIEAMLAKVKSELKDEDDRRDAVKDSTDDTIEIGTPSKEKDNTSTEPKANVKLSTTQHKETKVKVDVSTTKQSPAKVTTEKVTESTTLQLPISTTSESKETKLNKETKAKVKDAVAALISEKMHENAKGKKDGTDFAAKKLYSTLPDGTAELQSPPPHAPPRQLGLACAFFGLVALILGMARLVAIRARGPLADDTAVNDEEQGLE